MKHVRASLAMVGAIALLTFGSTSGADEIKGKVKAVSNLARTLALEVDGKGLLVIKFDQDTQFKNAASAAEIIADEVVVVDYAVAGPENKARTITKVIAPLPAGVSRITAEELQKLLKGDARSLLLVDSRPPSKYHEGHLPRAVSIPLGELEKEGEKLLPADKGQTLVFYCGGLSCVLSPRSAAIAVKLGFRDVRVYPEGEPGWKKLEYATESTLSYVKSGNIVLIDLRPPAQVQAGHIPRAVSIPATALGKAEAQFPEFKGAPIVFYSDSEADLNEALELTRDWEYKNATIFPGGVKAWQAAGNALATGAAPTRISYVRKLGAGEVSIKDFEDIVKTGSHQIIDARTADEFRAGHFAGVSNIPSEEMAVRHGEIAANKPAVIHCSTGARAEMAYDILKDKGIKAVYLRANVAFDAGGKVAFRE